MFKKMHSQKKKEVIKEYEKQEKRLKEMKQQGQSKKQAVSVVNFTIIIVTCYLLCVCVCVYVGKETKGSFDS